MDEEERETSAKLLDTPVRTVLDEVDVEDKLIVDKTGGVIALLREGVEHD